MSDESKPREFWIGRWKPDEYPLREGAIIQVAVTTDKRWDESFAVIEYSAYEELKREVERLTERYKNIELANKEMSRNAGGAE